MFKIRSNLAQKIFGYVVVILVISALTWLLIFLTSKKHQSGRYAEFIKSGVLYHVTKVLDGDTLVANVSGHEVTVRLIGIDTPEVVDPRKPVQCYGPEASAKAKEILSNKDIYLEKESAKGDYDIYGRVLAYAHFADGNLYNQYMIENGFAREYTFNKEKYKYQKEFKEAESKAKVSKIGLWGKCS